MSKYILILALTMFYTHANSEMSLDKLDLNGVQLGQTESEVKGKFSNLRCRDSSDSSYSTVCFDFISKKYFYGTTHGIGFYFLNNKLAAIKVDYYGFTQRGEDFLKNKLGTPFNEEIINKQAVDAMIEKGPSDYTATQMYKKLLTWKLIDNSILVANTDNCMGCKGTMYLVPASKEEQYKDKLRQ